ncbi:peptidase S8/S53 domain-containing protein [Sporodiniella umbellata]|nr:peptidase S8/S53 domain-containing protein [Sporodiniella umbellata]
MNIAQDYSSPSTLFRGVSICFQDIGRSLGKRSDPGVKEEDLILRNLLQSHTVKHIYPVTEIPRPTVKHHAHLSAYNPTRLLPKIKIPDNHPPLPFSHALTQVDVAHQNMELKGKNVVIGIIDSGIDYRHPAFGGGFGVGFPVRYGYDLVGDKFVSTDPTSRSENDTPLDTCENGSGHGTHVAGIIAANDRSLNFTGIAPEATLGVWRIFGCDGSTSNDLVIKALISAYDAGCDIINLSLGTPSNWADDPTSVVANRITERGITVVAAAGNEGSDGAFYISAPGTGANTISVASTDNKYSLTQAFQLTTNFRLILAYTLSTTTSTFIEGRLVAYTLTSSQMDGCNNTLPYRDIQGSIVLIQRGSCVLDNKVEMAQKYGAKGVVFYDNQPKNSFRAMIDNEKLPVISISKEAGESIKEQLKSKGTLEIVSSMTLIPQKIASGNQISPFSSIGPLYDLGPKPDIAGPGGFIFSTLPLSDGGYGVLSGTSMAAPYISGAIALFIEARGKRMSSTFIKEHFQNYAQPVIQDAIFDSPARQGAGLIQVYDAIRQSPHVSPGQISFNDTANLQAQTLTIHNPSAQTLTFSIRHQAGLSLAPFLAWDQHFTTVSPSKTTTEPVMAKLGFSTTEVTLAPGQTAPVTVQVLGVKGETTGEPFPIYGGYIQIQPEGGRAMHVPYMGIQGSLARAPLFASGFPQLGEEVNRFGKKTPTHYVINRKNATLSEISILYRLLTGTAHLKTEVLDKDKKLIGTASVDKFVPRNTMGSYVFVDRWNATIIPLGSHPIDGFEPLAQGAYYLRWKALKLLSDPAKETSWETQLSPLILVQ